jgi:hypothetical protein
MGAVVVERVVMVVLVLLVELGVMVVAEMGLPALAVIHKPLQVPIILEVEEVEAQMGMEQQADPALLSFVIRFDCGVG